MCQFYILKFDYNFYIENSISVTNASGLNLAKIYNNIARDAFLILRIHSCLRVMIHASAEQKVDEKRIILKCKTKREENAFYLTHMPPILRLKAMDYFYRNSVTQ